MDDPEQPSPTNDDEKPVPLARFAQAYQTTLPEPEPRPAGARELMVFVVTALSLLVTAFYFDPSPNFLVLLAALGGLGLVASRRILRGVFLVLGGGVLLYALLVIGTFGLLFLYVMVNGPIMKMQ